MTYDRYNRRLALLWFFAVLWPALQGFPGLRAPGWLTRLVPALTTFEGALAMVGIGAALLAFATATTIIGSLLHAPLTLAAIARAVLAITYFCGVVTVIFLLGASQDTLASRIDDASSIAAGKLDGVCDQSEGRVTPTVARAVYRELGVCIAYRGETESLQRFQPTDQDRQLRLRTIEMQRESDRLRDQLARQAEFSRAAAVTHLLALPIALASCLLWAKRWKGQTSARANR